MKGYTSANLEALARGGKVCSEAFLAILCDDEARTDLGRMLQVQELRDPPSADAPPADPPDLSVSFDELARYAEQRLSDLGRALAVERFLARHFPEDLDRIRALAAGADTHIEFVGTDTHVEFRPGDAAARPQKDLPGGGQKHV